MSEIASKSMTQHADNDYHIKIKGFDVIVVYVFVLHASEKFYVFKSTNR